MRVHVIRHVPFEGPGVIARWAEERGHTLTESFALTEEFPDPADVGLLVVMGGPMAADDHDGNPWLVAEKSYLRRALDGGSRVLGVCLGAQILANCLGGRVRRNPRPEIGFFPIELTFRGASNGCFQYWAPRFVVGHWHGDTFDLPLDIDSAALSEATANQAFCYDHGRAVGLQFHLEWTAEDLELLIAECGDELGSDREFVQSAEEIRRLAALHLPGCHQALRALLDGMCGARA